MSLLSRTFEETGDTEETEALRSRGRIKKIDGRLFDVAGLGSFKNNCPDSKKQHCPRDKIEIPEGPRHEKIVKS